MQTEIIEPEVVVPQKHISTEVVIVNKPSLPDTWDYNKSVEKTKGLILNWNTITSNILMELWIAREILSMSPSDAAKIMHGTIVPRKTWSNYCEEIGLWRQTANRWLSRWTTREETNPPPLPVGINYSIIYADPPWKYDFSETISREIEQKYPTMDLNKLKKMLIPSDKNALLFLWATAPKLREALEVMDVWGFEYKTHAIWDKERIGMGYWFRGQHELLLIGVRGEFSPPKEKQRVSSVIRIPRGKHSEKPNKIRELIDGWYPKHKKIELFARTRYKDWDVWGNEAPR